MPRKNDVDLPDNMTVLDYQSPTRIIAPVAVWQLLGGLWPWAVLLSFVITVSACALGLIAQDWATSAGAPFSKPGLSHWLGTNALGQDVGARLVQALYALVLDVFPGAVLTLSTACMAGFFAALHPDSWWDRTVLLAADVLEGLPSYLLLVAMAVVAKGVPGGTSLLMMLLFFSSAARNVRQQALVYRKMAFFDGAQVIGLSSPQLIVRQLWPVTKPAILATALVVLGNCMKAQLVLGFLGIDAGARPSLGALMSEGVIDAMGGRAQGLLASLGAGFVLLLALDTLAKRQPAIRL
jgi:peptide/nickel transport system permease protein